MYSIFFVITKFFLIFFRTFEFVKNSGRKQTNHIWNNIPLEDYERHMRHENVGQLQLLSELTGKYLRCYRPDTVLFLGVSGGNGLEHIDNRITRKVIGIDINREYLDETKKRFSDRIPGLALVNLDINESKRTIARVYMVWAALIFEYVDMEIVRHESRF